MLPLKSFYFLRHGQTDWNNKHIAMGQIDISLNVYGLEQAHFAATTLNDVDFVSIAASPLSRALQTAKIIAEKTGRAITVVDEFKEASWGVMEGKSKGDGFWIQSWRNGEYLDGAECFSAFRKRVLRRLKKVLSELPGPVLIVSHGGVYWAIQEALGLPFVDMPNCVPIFHRPPAKRTDNWFVSGL